MAIKFIRQYRMEIQQSAKAKPASSTAAAATFNKPDTLIEFVNLGTLTSPSPLTVEFDIEKSAISEGGKATFRLYNLPDSVADSIVKDWFDGMDIRSISFYAGYRSPTGNLMSLGPNSLIFQGQLMTVHYSQASGSPDKITTITAIDALWDRAFAMCVDTSGNALQTFTSATSAADKVKALVNCMPFVSHQPVISTVYSSVFSSKPQSFSGSAWSAICDLTEGRAFIDNGVVYWLDDQDYYSHATASGPAPSDGIYDAILMGDRDILGKPRRSGTLLEVDMIFSPEVHNGQLVQIKLSDKNSPYNGIWKVYQVFHRGMISSTVDTGCRTTVALWKGPGVDPSLSSNWQPVSQSS